MGLLISKVYSQADCSYPGTHLWKFESDATLGQGATDHGFSEGQVSYKAREFKDKDFWQFGSSNLQFPLTIAMWVKNTGGAVGYQGLFESSQNQALANYFYLYWFHTKLGTEFRTAANDFCRYHWEGVFTQNVWVHIMVTYSHGNDIVAYKNNVALTPLEPAAPGCSAGAPFMQLNFQGRNQNRIGVNYLGVQQFIGFIEDFILYQRILSIAELDCVYSGQFYNPDFPCMQTYGGKKICNLCVNAAGGSNRVIPAPTGDCRCQTGFYEPAIQTNKCPPCDNVCTTCVTTSGNCTACVKPNMVTPNCKCIDGQYEILPSGGVAGTDEQCLPCLYYCKTCVDNTACTSCDGPTDKRQNGPAPNACPCQDGFYDLGNAKICQPCSVKCARCVTNQINCLQCKGLFRNMVDLPNCRCQDRYYDNNQQSDCLLCAPQCQKCDLTASNCTQCRGNNRLAGIPSCACQSHYYDDGNILGDCRICSDWCNDCSNNPSNCLTCRGANRDISTAPACNCEAGYYHVGVADCVKCPYYCKTCSDATTCTSCYQEATREQTGNCDCIPFYYNVGTNLICEPCHPNCYRCNGPLDIQCTGCTGNKSVQGGQCLCAPGYYTKDGNCLQCKNNCAACIDGTRCTQCSTNPAHFRVNNVALNCPCVQGYYDDGATIICRLCHNLCKGCAGQATQFYCTECFQGKIFNTSSFGIHLVGTCKIPCIDGTYDKLDQCPPCHPSCRTCTGGTTKDCISCPSDPEKNFRIAIPNKQKECSCIDGYFEANQLQCQKCSSSCKTCHISASNCLSCIGNNKKLPKCDCIVDHELNVNNDCQQVLSTDQNTLQISLMFMAFIISLQYLI